MAAIPWRNCRATWAACKSTRWTPSRRFCAAACCSIWRLNAPLADDWEVTPGQLEAACKVEIRPGDVVLLRTGWARYFEDARKFINETRLPGPGLAAAPGG